MINHTCNSDIEQGFETEIIEMCDILFDDNEVVIPTSEYRELVASETMLDMIIASIGDYSADTAVVKAAAAIRRRNAGEPIPPTPEGDNDAE